MMMIIRQYNKQPMYFRLVKIPTGAQQKSYGLVRTPAGRQLIRRCLLLLTFSLIAAMPLFAQKKIQVVTKTIIRTFALGKKDILSIQAEKASVSIQGWAKDEVKLVLKLVAKHPERATAERDLLVARCDIQTETSIKKISNYFFQEEGRPGLESNLQAVYELWVPQQRNLKVSDNYGNLRVSQWQGNLSITHEFGEVRLQQVQGSTQLHIAYGDVIADTLEGDFSCDAQKSNIQLKQIGGRYHIKSNYGKITVQAAASINQFTVDASRTEIEFATADAPAYRYQLTTSCDAIVTILPGTREEDDNPLSCKKSFTTIDNTQKPLIKISTTYSPITIKSYQP